MIKATIFHTTFNPLRFVDETIRRAMLIKISYHVMEVVFHFFLFLTYETLISSIRERITLTPKGGSIVSIDE